MCVGNGDQMPLYMSQVIRVLREMAIENKGGTFDYLDFRKRLEDLNLNRMQTPFLHQRLDLLDSYLDLKGEHNGDYFLMAASLSWIYLAHSWIRLPPVFSFVLLLNSSYMPIPHGVR